MGMTGIISTGGKVSGNLSSGAKTAAAEVDTETRYIQGPPGEDGYTPIKGVDYFDGKDGKDGKDGYTPQKGIDYVDGKDGYTPIKGVDYYTDAERAEMVEDVMNSTNVKPYAEEAKAAASAAANSKAAAASSASAAAASESASKAAQAAAEKARDEAQQAAGGDFATPAYVDGKFAEAKAYTDEAVKDAGKVKSVNGMVGDVTIESDVFYAVYGTTTTAELEAALTAGKAVYCKNGAYVARFLRKNSAATRHVFGYRDNEYLCDSDTWSTSVVKFSPAAHAETHAANGSDPITPDAIGAATPAYVDEKIAAIPKPTVPTKTSELTNDSGFATTTYVDNAVANAGGGGSWELLAEYATAGSYTFTVPDDVDELGVLILGGGGSGGAACSSSGTYGAASGGGSGEIIQEVLKKADGDFAAGEAIAVVVGAKGAAVSTTSGGVAGKNGGSSSFKGVTAAGGNGGKGASGSANSLTVDGSGGSGQSSDNIDVYSVRNNNAFGLYNAPFGIVPIWEGRDADLNFYFAPPSRSASAFIVMNRFDPSDAHIYCGAGGGAVKHGTITMDTATLAQSVVTRARGKAGAGKMTASNATVTASSATAPGDGGGGASGYNAKTAKSGAGAAGLVLVYGRRTS